MKNKYYHWQIAFRTDNSSAFVPIQNPKYGWAADPFLVEYKGTIYLFAEIFLFKSERKGVVGYCKYDGHYFGEWTITMDKHWHLSYPNVFVCDDKLYMCPESNQSEEVCIYELVSFPNNWIKKRTVLTNGRYADTTFCDVDGRRLWFTFKHTNSNIEGTLQLYVEEKDKIEWVENISSDIGKARPGGNFYEENGHVYRVSQNCLNGYGHNLNIMRVDTFYPHYQEEFVREINLDDVNIDSKKKYVGIHTYNRLNNIEVIDMKYSSFSIVEYLAKKRVKKIFVNKY